VEFARTAQGIGNEDRKSVNQSALLTSKLDPGYIEAVSEGQKITQKNYRPMIPQWSEMGDIIGAHIETVFTGGTSAQDALTAAANEVSARFKAEGVLGTDRPYRRSSPTSDDVRASSGSSRGPWASAAHDVKDDRCSPLAPLE
jgi:hypothetical protein